MDWKQAGLIFLPPALALIRYAISIERKLTLLTVKLDMLPCVKPPSGGCPNA
jgi:hypothetical protein